jgi:hypothetical protein
MDGINESTFYLYRAIQKEVSEPGFRLDPVNSYSVKPGAVLNLTVPGESIHTLTTIHLLHEDQAAGNR